VKVSFLARDRERIVPYRTVPMYIPDMYQNDRDEKLNQKKFTLMVTRQERNFHCSKIGFTKKAKKFKHKIHIKLKNLNLKIKDTSS
jgi:hypothetical protein